MLPEGERQGASRAAHERAMGVRGAGSSSAAGYEGLLLQQLNDLAAYQRGHDAASRLYHFSGCGLMILGFKRPRPGGSAARLLGKSSTLAFSIQRSAFTITS